MIIIWVVSQKIINNRKYCDMTVCRNGVCFEYPEFSRALVKYGKIINGTLVGGDIVGEYVGGFYNGETGKPEVVLCKFEITFRLNGTEISREDSLTIAINFTDFERWKNGILG